jgi:hypothetical protein
MDPRDDDIEFDFFDDEAATTEAQSSQPRVRLPRRGGGGTGRRRPVGPAGGMQPLLRLLALIAILVAALVFFGLLIQSCASTSKHDAYSSYMANVTKIARGSQDDGSSVANALTTPGAKATDIAKSLDGVAEQERQNAAAAQRLDPPGHLRPENQQLVEALQLRVDGVQGLADALRSTASSTASTDATVLSEQADRLVASDVVYDDLFKAPAVAEMKAQGVSGVVVPDSTFVTSRDLVTERSMSQLLQRLRGASTSGGGQVTGLHGTNLVSVKALPAGTVLSQTSENTVKASTDLAFAVTLKDSGDFQEVGIKVTITLQRDSGGKAIVKTQTVNVINPGQEKTLTFSGLNVSGFFALKSHLRVNIAPVKGESNPTNNKGSFPVIFSL